MTLDRSAFTANMIEKLGYTKSTKVPAETMMLIRAAEVPDAHAVTDILNESISTETSSLFTTPRPVSEITGMITASSGKYPFLVCVSEAEEGSGSFVVGAAWAKAWSPREGYANTVETSIYLARPYRGLGIGGRLYAELLSALRSAGHRTVIAGITLPNPASVRLHEQIGFIKVGHMYSEGYKFNQWLDVGYWQLVYGDMCKGV